jgi:sugar-specific transcriptional regulator TrmB
MDYLLTSLTQIGFTEYEAKVYLALLHESPATGYQISKKSGVPRSMVYDALGRLSARGAALETMEGRATLYRPLPPDVLLNRYEEEQRHLVESLHSGLEKLYNATDEDKIWSITGRRATLAYATQMIREAQDEIYLVINDQDLSILFVELTSAHDRGVSVNTLLTGEAELDLGRTAHHPPLENELQELTDTLMIVIDNQKTLIASTNHETVATITGNHNLVLMARQFVWMELFAQRIYTRLGSELINQLDPEDQRIFEGLAEK